MPGDGTAQEMYSQKTGKMWHQEGPEVTQGCTYLKLLEISEKNLDSKQEMEEAGENTSLGVLEQQ